MNYSKQRERLRAVLAGTECLSPATVFDALSARVAEAVGYEIGILSGSVTSNTTLAAPDLNLQTLTEFADQVRRIMRVSEDLAARGVRILLRGHQPVAAVVKALHETYTHLYNSSEKPRYNHLFHWTQPAIKETACGRR